MEYTQKLVYQSNYWYNDGLKRAKIRDMSGAVTSLKKSLQYNRENVAARNLLGLVYYGRGEVGEALVEWILSKNFQSHDNIANYYIQKVQGDPEGLSAVNQAIRRYNQSLDYCGQDGEDLAIIQLKKAIQSHPSFLKAYQLLALLYLKTEQYSKARQTLKIAHKLDTTNDITLRYMHEMKQLRKKGVIHSANKDEKTQAVSYQVGNDTVIQPAAAGIKGHAGLMTLINILTGVVVGLAVMCFLIMPAITKSNNNKTNRQIVEFSDRIATEEAQISALKKELEEYRSSGEAAEAAQQTAESTQESYEIVMSIYNSYVAGDMSDEAMVAELLKVNPDALGIAGREQYDSMTGVLFDRYGSVLYENARENYELANYAEAISALSTLMQMNAGYDDGYAMLLLAQCYEASGDSENANSWYATLEQSYPGLRSEAAAQSTDEYSDYDDTGYYDEYSEGYE